LNNINYHYTPEYVLCNNTLHVKMLLNLHFLMQYTGEGLWDPGHLCPSFNPPLSFLLFPLVDFPRGSGHSPLTCCKTSRWNLFNTVKQPYKNAHWCRQEACYMVVLRSGLLIDVDWVAGRPQAVSAKLLSAELILWITGHVRQ